jgi:phenylacetate-CoA ligase
VVNWRRPFIFSALAATRSEIPEALREMSRLAVSAPETVARCQEELLEQLLRHAWRCVPYYRPIFEETGVVAEGEVRLENFTRLPLLDKRLIRENDRDLQARGRRRGVYCNASGGSTGEPVRLLQDRHYSDWNIANTIHYKTFADQRPGDPEVRLWGSERDLKGSRSLGGALRDLLYNRTDLNTFRMTIPDMEKYVEVINRVRPTWIEAYAQSAFEMARFVKANGLCVHSPRGVLTSAGNLYPEMRELIEEVFACTVYNRYGSREVGGMACSCDRQEGLHLSPWNHYLEIVDEEGRAVPPGARGKVCVTALRNLSMPLIRYDIGDVATRARAGHEICSCGRTGMPLVHDVRGRNVTIFTTPDGTKIDGELFAHLLYFRAWCRRFQAAQISPDEVVVRVVVMEGMEQDFERDRVELDKELARLLGTACRTGVEVVSDIEPVQSGKHLDAVVEVS